MYLAVFSVIAYGIYFCFKYKDACKKAEIKGYEEGLRAGYKEGQRDAKVVDILEKNGYYQLSEEQRMESHLKWLKETQVLAPPDLQP